ncbi:MAG: plasmid pRiA4b ORF-3 family protein [Armatimonadia bacterium]
MATLKLYRLRVTLKRGPVTEEFARANPTVARTFEIRGDQTLDDLHEAIMQEFQRWDAHLYEFEIEPRGKRQNLSPYFVLPFDLEEGLSMGEATRNDATKTKLSSLYLKVGDDFSYLFDYGDGWRHLIEVEAITTLPIYPRVVASEGDIPPQSVEWDDSMMIYGDPFPEEWEAARDAQADDKPMPEEDLK